MLRRLILGVLALILLAIPVSAGPFAWVVSTYDLAATSFTYCKTNPFGSTPLCGATAADGWITMAYGERPIVAAVEWVTNSATSLEYSLECRPYTSGLGQAIDTGSLTAAGAKYVVILSNANAFDQCRIGLKITTDTGTNSVTSYFSMR